MYIINPIIWTPGMLTSSSVPETDYTAWSSATSYTVGARVIMTSTHKIYECLSYHKGATGASGTITMTVGSPCVVTWTSHGQSDNTPIIFTSTGVLPTGLSVGIKYYIINSTANTFNVSNTPNGIAIVTTGAQGGAHTCTSPSTSPDVSSGTAAGLWIDIGSTLRHKMFDDKWGTQTTATSTLTVVLSPGKPIDSIALLNLIGKSVTVTCTRGAVTIYTKTIPLQTDIGVFDWQTYFLAPIVAEDDTVITDLLPYGDQLITITITGTGTVAIGAVTMGSKVYIGSLQSSPTVGIVDYTVKTTDIYGSIVVTPRAYSKRMSCKLATQGVLIDQLPAILASVRATPVVWVASETDLSSLVIWGFFKDFEVDIAYTMLAYCTLTIEGIV